MRLIDDWPLSSPVGQSPDTVQKPSTRNFSLALASFTSMRRVLPLLMILLLTLRGLLGDAMAMGNLPDVVPHMSSAGTAQPHAAPHAGQKTPADSHSGDMHDMGSSLHAAADMPPGTEHCTSTTPSAPGCAGSHHSTPCAACGICHSVLSSPAAVSPPHALPAHATPVSGQARFASAALLQAIKPPIA